MNRQTQAHLTIVGRVQGVAFRAAAAQRALAVGLTGWVRNLPDGGVEIVVEGPGDVVRSFVGWCAVGPAHAEVRDVSAAYAPPTGEFQGFAIR